MWKIIDFNLSCWVNDSRRSTHSRRPIDQGQWPAESITAAREGGPSVCVLLCIIVVGTLVCAARHRCRRLRRLTLPLSVLYFVFSQFETTWTNLPCLDRRLHCHLPYRRHLSHSSLPRVFAGRVEVLSLKTGTITSIKLSSLPKEVTNAITSHVNGIIT